MRGEMFFHSMNECTFNSPALSINFIFAYISNEYKLLSYVMRDCVQSGKLAYQRIPKIANVCLSLSLNMNEAKDYDSSSGF